MADSRTRPLLLLEDGASDGNVPSRKLDAVRRDAAVKVAKGNSRRAGASWFFLLQAARIRRVYISDPLCLVSAPLGYQVDGACEDVCFFFFCDSSL